MQSDSGDLHPADKLPDAIAYASLTMRNVAVAMYILLLGLIRGNFECQRLLLAAEAALLV